MRIQSTDPVPGLLRMRIERGNHRLRDLDQGPWPHLVSQVRTVEVLQVLP